MRKEILGGVEGVSQMLPGVIGLQFLLKLPEVLRQSLETTVVSKHIFQAVEAGRVPGKLPAVGSESSVEFAFNIGDHFGQVNYHQRRVVIKCRGNQRIGIGVGIEKGW